jgi:type IV fimbrial biogenesis protein FimT
MRYENGLTLIELLIGIALIGVLAGLAIPAFGGVIERTTARTVSDRFQAELAFARSEAVFRRRQVVVCRTPDLWNCTYIGPWSMGTMTFEDRDNDKIRDPSEPILRTTSPADYGGLHLVDAGRRYHVSFRPDGRSGGTNMTLKLCNRALDPLGLLVINVGGRVRAAEAGPSTTRCGE